jgi:hypothetical protein
MKRRIMMLLLAVVVLTSFSTVMAQDGLKWFPEDVKMFIQVDLPTVEKIISSDNILGLQEEMFDGVDFDIFAHFTTVWVGMVDEDAAYVVMKGDMNAAQLVELAKKEARKEEDGKELKFEVINLAGMKAYVSIEDDDENEASFIVDLAPGLVAAGPKDSMSSLMSVKTGRSKNASSNSGLMALANKVPDAPIKFFGSPDGKGEDLNGLAGGLNWKNSALEINMFLDFAEDDIVSEIVSGLDKLEAILPSFDDTNTLLDIYKGLKVKANGNTIFFSLTLPQKTIDFVNENKDTLFMSAMMAGMSAGSQ